jgi:hypothetical protein
MDNVKVRVVGSTLTLTVDLGVEGRPSSTGRSVIVATTSGWAPVLESPEHAFQLNIIRKKNGGAWRQKR